MGKVESKVQPIAYSAEVVYNTLSDFNNIGKVRDRVPSDLVKNLNFNSDSVSFEISPVGAVTMNVVDREPFKCIKMQTEKSMVPLTAWIQIVSTGENNCKIKLTADADVNIFIAKMVEKPLREGIEKIAEMLAAIPYDKI